MYLNSYLTKSRHDVFYLRIQRKNIDKKISLRTKDDRLARKIAYQLGALIMSSNNFHGWMIAKKLDGTIQIETDGTKSEYLNALEALKVVLSIPQTPEKSILQGNFPQLKAICLRDAIDEYLEFISTPHKFISILSGNKRKPLTTKTFSMTKSTLNTVC